VVNHIPQAFKLQGDYPRILRPRIKPIKPARIELGIMFLCRKGTVFSITRPARKTGIYRGNYLLHSRPF